MNGDEKQTAAVVLCGGKSTRMGASKATLPFGPELMLQRVVRLVAQVVDHVAVVAADRQPLPPLPDGTIVARDRREGRGPLEGLYAGLQELPPNVELAYATSCDVPLLVPDCVEHLFQLARNKDVVVPVEGPFHHPLSAVYRRSVVGVIHELLENDQLRIVFLYDRVNTLRLPVESLRQIDPQLYTLKNVNRPEDYAEALRAAGFDAPGGGEGVRG